MSLRLEDLDRPEAAGAQNGRPLSLPLDAIDEDPDQPRREFDPEGLREMANSIAEHGVLQPVSVRPHPQQPGRWMLNFGARRLRGARLVGVPEVPAFVDEKIDSYRQVVENEQRENLRPLELAMFVQRELQAGRSRADIARRLGKSRAYVTYVCALIDAPDCVMQAYREGKCRGVSELYELRKLHESAPQAVVALLSRREHVSRDDLAELRSMQPSSAGATGSKTQSVLPEKTDRSEPARADSASVQRSSGQAQQRATPAGPRSSPLRVTGTVDGVRVEIVLGRAPEDAASVFVLEPDGACRPAPLARVADLRLERSC